VGGNDIGLPGKREVKVYGVLESNSRLCPVCGSSNTNDEFDIYVENDDITHLSESRI